MAKSAEYKPANYKWSKENCRIEALKYDSKIEFKKNSRGAYPSALKNGWIDEICSHMIPKGNKYKRLIYRFVFLDNSCYVGLTYDSDRRKKEHLQKSNSSVYNHIKNTGDIPKYEELTDYIDVYESKIQEEFWKIKSQEQGYFILNISKTGALGSNLTKWTKEKCLEEALKYTSRGEFRNSLAYGASFRNGWLDEICSHMKPKYKYWNKTNCKEEALKYNTRYEYYVGSVGSHDSARRNGWLDEICSHMSKSRKGWNYWSIENCKKEAIKFDSEKELKRKNNYVYKILLNNNILDEIFKK